MQSVHLNYHINNVLLVRLRDEFNEADNSTLSSSGKACNAVLIENFQWVERCNSSVLIVLILSLTIASPYNDELISHEV